MKVNEIIDKFTIDPEKDIKPYLELEKTVREDKTQTGLKCSNCGDEINQVQIKSIPWTMVHHCIACKRFNVVYVQDRMGGLHLDIVEIYKDKE